MQVFVVLAQIENCPHHPQINLAVHLLAQDMEPNGCIDRTPNPAVPNNIELLDLDILELSREESLRASNFRRAVVLVGHSTCTR
jgi:hypothetical protein